MSFKRVLVANRGEIACRIIRTLKSLGIEAAVVYSEVDAAAPHVLAADRAALVGPAPATQSYLDAAAVVDAGRAMDCDAVHPGYGFLSENAAFAAACEDAGMTFIGPNAEAIHLMGDKAQARQTAESCGVPPVPGYSGPDGDAVLDAEATRIGYPLLVKAAFGGGGKGMRTVRSPQELKAAIAAARREAASAFGDGSLLLERLVHPARHVEVQVLADRQGRAVAMLERECSLQRRHQKVIEECPSPVVGEELRRRLGAAAVKLAQAVRYVGAGTVEFLLEEDESFWFLEMNTRLQVEHGVTEMVTGEDLVAWQIHIAAGRPLDPAWGEVFSPRGHALEARVYAEDPASGFLPQAGMLHQVALPRGPGIRVDSGVQSGQPVTPHYDPMLMKVLAHGRDREQARCRLLDALRELHIVGPKTNVGYLIDILEEDFFREARTWTHTLEERGPPSEPTETPPWQVLALAGWALAHEGVGGGHPAAPGSGDVHAPFDTLGPFRIVSPQVRP